MTRVKKQTSRRGKYVDEEQAQWCRENPQEAMRRAHEEGRQIREQVRKELEPMSRITQKDLDFTVR